MRLREAEGVAELKETKQRAMELETQVGVTSRKVLPSSSRSSGPISSSNDKIWKFRCTCPQAFQYVVIRIAQYDKLVNRIIEARTGHIS